jgi:hypothetical protein
VWRIGLLGGPRAVTGFAVTDDRRCTLFHRDGSHCDGTVDGVTLVTSPLVVLAMRDADGRSHRIVLAPDMASAETCRRLRVVLRWGRPQAAASRQA